MPDYDEQPRPTVVAAPARLRLLLGLSKGWTDQYRPTLLENYGHLPTPTDPTYHFSVDIIGRAIDRWRAARAAGPARPRLLCLAYGAGHSPI